MSFPWSPASSVSASPRRSATLGPLVGESLPRQEWRQIAVESGLEHREAPRKNVKYCPTATIAERRRFLERLAGTQLSEGVGTTMSATNLPGHHFNSLLRRGRLHTIRLRDLMHTCATILLMAGKTQ